MIQSSLSQQTVTYLPYGTPGLSALPQAYSYAPYFQVPADLFTAPSLRPGVGAVCLSPSTDSFWDTICILLLIRPKILRRFSLVSFVAFPVYLHQNYF